MYHRNVFLTLLVLLTSFACPVRAQKNKFGDNVTTLDGIIKAYYAVVNVKKGQRPSYQRDSSLHVADALVGGTNLGKEGRPAMHTMTLKHYHELEDTEMSKTGFYEKELSRNVEKFGGIYHVWSTYETRNKPDGPVVERGINTIELFFDGKRFWILSWFYDTERKDNRLPAEYLPN